MIRVHGLKPCELGARRLQITVERMQLRQLGLQGHILGSTDQQLFEKLAGTSEVAPRLEGLSVGEPAVRSLRQMFVEEGTDLRFRLNTHEVIDHVAVFK